MGDTPMTCREPTTYGVKAGRRSFHACRIHLSNVTDQALDHRFDTTGDRLSVEVRFLGADEGPRVCDVA